jgi:copper chaperone CopZ
MKKVFVLGLAALVLACFVIMPAFAEDCSKCPSKAVCAKGTAKGDAKKESSCSMDKAKCGTDGKCGDVNLTIKGMTDANSETKITDALKKIDGFIKVASINAKEGTATICYDPSKCKTEAMISAITSLGYEAKIVPASDLKVVSKGKVCSPDNKAACGGEAKTDKK